MTHPFWLGCSEGWRENITALLMSDDVEGMLCGQTGAGGWAGRLDGWMKLVKTHLWRSVLEPWSCYGVDIENLFCLGLRRVEFHLGEKEWQNRKILFWLTVGQPVCSALSGVNMEGRTGGNGHEKCLRVGGWGVVGSPVESVEPRRRISHSCGTFYFFK